MFCDKAFWSGFCYPPGPSRKIEQITVKIRVMPPQLLDLELCPAIIFFSIMMMISIGGNRSIIIIV